MTEFWLLAGLLLLLGYVFFIPVFMRQPATAPQVSRQDINLELHRQRQHELAAEDLDAAERDSLLQESARNLLTDLDHATEKPQAENKQGQIALIVSLCLLPMVIVVAYLSLGQPDMLNESTSPSASAPNTMEASIQKLAERLKEHPDDVEGWILLGRSLEATRQFERAATAYEFALKQTPDNVEIKAFYAEALAEANEGRLMGKPLQLVQEILAQDPLNKTALWMAGIAAAEQGNPGQAVAYWQTLKQQLPADSPDISQIDGYIAEVQGKSAPAASARPETGKTASAASTTKRIQVAVTLASPLAAKAQPDDAVFIFARAAEGPPMPLAVVRKQVRDLPIEVTLDDSMSMMPGRNLSSVDRIVLGARISKSGKPTSSPGDFQGLSQALTLENGRRYAITIEQVVGEK